MRCYTGSVLAIVLVICTAAFAQQESCVYTPGMFITIVETEYDCAILDCKTLTLNETRYTFDGWILSNVTYVEATYQDDKFTVDDQNWTIVIRNISRDDLGFYHCVLLADGDRYLVRMAINGEGPFFITGWEEYEKNTVIGLTCFGSFVVLLIICELLWKFRYRPEKDDASSLSDAGVNDVALKKQTPDAVEFKRSLAHPTVPGYVPHQDVIVSSLGPTTEIRKRSPAIDKKLGQSSTTTKELGGGVDNAAFVTDEDRYKAGKDAADEFLDDLETTSL